jgi:aldehyde dehydrogenase (NAD+)
MERIKVGAPPVLSNLISSKQGRRVLDYIEIGKAEGARLMTGGKRLSVEGHEAGYFIAPTVFQARNDMRIAQEEIFGPVLSVIRWNDYDQRISEANGVRYGLAAGRTRRIWETRGRRPIACRRGPSGSITTSISPAVRRLAGSRKAASAASTATRR